MLSLPWFRASRGELPGLIIAGRYHQGESPPPFHKQSLQYLLKKKG